MSTKNEINEVRTGYHGSLVLFVFGLNKRYYFEIFFVDSQICVSFTGKKILSGSSLLSNGSFNFSAALRG